MSKNPMHSAENVCHYTPEPIVIAARETLGGRIFLDPATDIYAQRVVRATVAYTDDGLERDWWGPVFVNPPGYDKVTNPDGAAAWWCRLVTEWNRAGHAWDAIFVGFSLELLQTVQRYGVPHPTVFTTCFFKKRIRFMVRPEEREAQLWEQLSAPGVSARKQERLEAEIASVRLSINAGRQFIEGASPTHGNFVTCLTDNAETHQRFIDNFSQFGAVT